MYGRLAQLEERVTYIHEVVGSSPTLPTIIKLKIYKYPLIRGRRLARIRPRTVDPVIAGSNPVVPAITLISHLPR